MQRVAFQLRVRAGKEAEYDRAHEAVWPELLRELESFGVREYSIFRRGQQLFRYLRVPSFDRLLEQLAASEINQRWQEQMAPLFEPVPDLGWRAVRDDAGSVLHAGRSGVVRPALPLRTFPG